MKYYAIVGFKNYVREFEITKQAHEKLCLPTQYMNRPFPDSFSTKQGSVTLDADSIAFVEVAQR